jgi:hypothetical protein
MAMTTSVQSNEDDDSNSPVHIPHASADPPEPNETSQGRPKFKFLKRGEGTYKRVYASKLSAQQRIATKSSNEVSMDVSVQKGEDIQPRACAGGESSDLQRGSTSSQSLSQAKEIVPQARRRECIERSGNTKDVRLISFDSTGPKRTHVAIRAHREVPEEGLGTATDSTIAPTDRLLIPNGLPTKQYNRLSVSRPFGTLVRSLAF